MLQHYYRNGNIVPGGDKILRLLQFFSYKLGKEVTITDLLNDRNIDNEIKEKTQSVFRAKRTRINK